MIAAIQIVGAGGGGVVAVEVGNSQADIIGVAHSIGALELGNQILQSGLQDVQTGNTIHGLCHGAGHIQHNDHVRALLDGNTGGGQLDPSQTRGLEVDARSGLVDTDRALVGVVGIIHGGNRQNEFFGHGQVAQLDGQTLVNTGLAEVEVTLQHGNGHGLLIHGAIIVGNGNGRAGLGGGLGAVVDGGGLSVNGS